MKTKLVTLLPFLLQILLVSCSSVSFVDMTRVQTELGLSAFPEQKDYPEADAVVLWEEHDVHAVIDENYDLVTEEEVTKVMKLFKNVDEYASDEITIYSGDKLLEIQARTIKADESVVELKKEDFHTMSGVSDGYVFYSDDKKVRFTYPAVEKNCILELRYKMFKSRPFVEGIWDIQSSIPVLRNIFKLTVPVILMQPRATGGFDWTWRYKWYNCDPIEPVIERNITPSRLVRENTVTFMWSKSSIPAFEPDPMMDAYSNHLQYVKFSPSDWKSWNDISGWYCKHFLRPQEVTSDRVSGKAAELTQGCKTETEKITKLFAFVQTLRYVAIELGRDGYRPSKPQEVLDRMYGDCKDKSLLLLSLLKSEGIEAKPALVLTAEHGQVDPTFPTWSFNHMMVLTTTKDSTDYWLDPTADHCGVGEIPYEDQGTTALILNHDNSSSLQTIPADTCEANILDLSINTDLTDPTQTDFAVAMTFSGQENLRMRGYFADKTREDIAKFCRSLVADQSLDSKLIDYSFRNMDNADSCLVFNFKLGLPSPVEHQGELTFLKVDPFGLYGNWAWLARDERKYAIHFNYPRVYHKTIEVILPKDHYSIRNLPGNVMIEKSGLRYEKAYGTDGNDRIVVNETFSIRESEIDAQRFQEVKDFVGSMKNEAGRKIILTERSK